jgi:hypothetical protein
MPIRAAAVLSHTEIILQSKLMEQLLFVTMPVVCGKGYHKEKRENHKSGTDF